MMGMEGWRRLLDMKSSDMRLQHRSRKRSIGLSTSKCLLCRTLPCEREEQEEVRRR